jgi:D-alanyl-D-alanine carboxypeptidase
LYGHDGATYGTISIALSSRDGSRQIAAGITGRNLTADPDALYDLNELLVPMLQASCS